MASVKQALSCMTSLINQTSPARSYGPFTVDGGRHTTESNASFDASLRQARAGGGYSPERG